jgi:hypothetical protein
VGGDFVSREKEIYDLVAGNPRSLSKRDLHRRRDESRGRRFSDFAETHGPKHQDTQAFDVGLYKKKGPNRHRKTKDVVPSVRRCEFIRFQ